METEKIEGTRTFWMCDGKPEVLCGDIRTACRDAAMLIERGYEPFSFDFNGIEVKARPGVTGSDLAAEWGAAMDGRWRKRGERESRRKEARDEAVRLLAVMYGDGTPIAPRLVERVDACLETLKSDPATAGLVQGE